MRNQLLCALFVLLSFFQGSAQFSRVELGLGFGVAAYQGDISPNWYGSMNKPGFGLAAFASYAFNPALSLRGNFAMATIHDNEKMYGGYHPYRNFSFETTINELSALLVINPLLLNSEAGPRRLAPYFFGGAGIGLLSIKRDFSKFDYSFGFQPWVFDGITKDSLTALPTSTVLFPVGAGLRYQIGENVALYLEGAKRFVQNDYLDGFSQAANRERKDAFTTFNIGLILRLSEMTGGRGNRGGYGCPVNTY